MFAYLDITYTIINVLNVQKENIGMISIKNVNVLKVLIGQDLLAYLVLEVDSGVQKKINVNALKDQHGMEILVKFNVIMDKFLFKENVVALKTLSGLDLNVFLALEVKCGMV